ncbi:MAG: hypothetical protein ABEI99_02025, partial [Halobaculum sp.]
MRSVSQQAAQRPLPRQRPRTAGMPTTVSTAPLGTAPQTTPAQRGDGHFPPQPTRSQHTPLVH